MGRGDATERIIEAVRPLLDRAGRGAAVVAMDGPAGSGKSTLAASLVAAAPEALGVPGAVIDGDDFYQGGVDWRSLSPPERADRCIDWRAQREVLAAIRTRRPASWRPYDWDRDDGTSQLSAVILDGSARLVILEGTFSARPELADLLDLRVRLAVAPAVQRARFAGREGVVEWEAWADTWLEAERHYFATLPAGWFDLELAT